ncbi:ketopantoate reductase family protein [Formosa algae]|uniref:2-dehydropantoate 2-reductase n=1 Tax=Formosa algae TaxID=225843 RepID=A0A9X0YLI8_9FLAO|nr:2-dehydropantoate 2-reductase [Formosa algae]MBP1840790.1 2-dehydropantoate 2-reductase [Formosa algae]MDQ0336313.1 2-dehydropantoate 2-reductase [Formosa algae]OEI80339.1 hypothetical protein AST99_09990 [Formosa algae]
MKIGILGMGGIGSFIGAKLTKNYENDPETDIIFICRNATKKAINQDGLTLITADETLTAKPFLTSDVPEEIGTLDMLILATKSFSLAQAIKTYQDCIKEDTVIIPLQNGVDAKDIIVKNLNHYNSNILEGCIYVASNIEKPGVVKHLGGPGKIVFGNTDEIDFKWVETILTTGGLQATYTKDIKTFLWKKYMFVSPVATMTSALNIPFGALVENAEYMRILENMMKEVKALANAFNVTITDQDIEAALGMLSNFPYQSKSSLQLDFENNSPQTEKYNLVDYVIEQGETFEITVDTYKDMNKKIIALYTT